VSEESKETEWYKPGIRDHEPERMKEWHRN